MIDSRDDGKDTFCRVTDFATILCEDHGYFLFNSIDDFRKNLWLVTSRTIQVPHNYFSILLGGFLIPPLENWAKADIKIHSLYGTHANDHVDLSPCPLLPLHTLGGLVGVVTVKYSKVANVYHEATAKIVFGYPPDLRQPIARIVGDCNDDEAPLETDLRAYWGLEVDSHPKQLIRGIYHDSLFTILISLGTVFHKGMIFTRLDIQLDTWY